MPWQTLLWVAWLALLVAGGCSPHMAIYPQIEQLKSERRYAEAAQVVEKARDTYDQRNRVLWNLDRGLLYHYAGRWEDSNRAFEEAERRMDELYTESISANVGAVALNDNTLPYRGEDFESVVVNLYRALNYAELGQMDEALVEARKVDLKLAEINRGYDEGERNVYREDAFARTLMGVFYEMAASQDDLNDAYISNRKAVDIYTLDYLPNYKVGPPGVLLDNLLTTAAFMGGDELRTAQATLRGRGLVPLEDKSSLGQVYVVLFAGRSPHKVEEALRVDTLDGNRVKIVMPRYQATPYIVSGARVSVDGASSTQLELAEPLGAIAVQSLENRRGRIAAKAVLRAAIKYKANEAVQREARKRDDGTELWSMLLGMLFIELSEQADLRAWQLLPDRVLLGRLLLPPGRHRVRIEYTGSGGHTVSHEEISEINVQAGGTRLLLLHTNR